jgi:hypothetical protein
MFQFAIVKQKFTHPVVNFALFVGCNMTGKQEDGKDDSKIPHRLHDYRIVTSYTMTVV